MKNYASIVAASVFAATATTYANTYYLSPNGDDGNSGTSVSAAFKTWAATSSSPRRDL